MTDFLLIPDVEALTSQYLRSLPSVTALVSQRVFTDIPHNDDAALPLVRLTQFDSTDAIPQRMWLDAASLQVDAYGGPKATASLIGRTVRAALHDMTGEHDEGIVTGVRTGGWRYAPDEPDDTDTPARPRFIFIASLWVHPSLVPGS